MKEFWNDRYKNDEFAYGIDPNMYFKKQLDKNNSQGKILLPAEGEGRNAIYAAKQGWEVVAFDLSIEGKNKAENLAKGNDVTIDYHVGEFSALTFEPESFDAIALIYAHFPAELKSAYHKKLTTYLKPNGLLIFEAFSKEQLIYNSKNPNAGGPKAKDMLFSVEELQNDFHEFDILELKEEKIHLNEGLFHVGESSVLRFVGRKT